MELYQRYHLLLYQAACGILKNRDDAQDAMPLVINFKVICGGNTFRHKKPHPGMLNALIKKMKIKKKDCLFIGDSEHDYEAALNSKVDFLLKLNGFTRKPKSYFKCKKFLNYKSLLKNIKI